MKRRHFLTLGTAALAAPALPSVHRRTPSPAARGPRSSPWSAASPTSGSPRTASSGDNGWARATFFSGLMAAYR